MLPLAFWCPALFLGLGWLVYPFLFDRKEFSLWGRLAIHFCLSVGIISVLGIVAYIAGYGLSSVRAVIIGLFAFLLVLRTVRWWRRRMSCRIHWREALEVRRRHKPDLILGAFAIFCSLLALWSGPWLSHTADSFSYLAAVRTLVNSDQVLVEEFIYSADVSTLDPQAGTWHLVLALLASFSQTDPTKIWLYLPAVVTPIWILSFYALALTLFRNRSLATAGTILHFILLYNLDFRMVAYPRYVGFALVWIALSFSLRYLKSGHLRFLLSATFLGFVLSTFHVNSCEFFLVSLLAYFLFYVLFQAVRVLHTGRKVGESGVRTELLSRLAKPMVVPHRPGVSSAWMVVRRVLGNELTRMVSLILVVLLVSLPLVMYKISVSGLGSMARHALFRNRVELWRGAIIVAGHRSQQALLLEILAVTLAFYLLIACLRNDRTAIYLFSNTLIVPLVLYNPVLITLLEGKVGDQVLLRLVLVPPYGLVVVYSIHSWLFHVLHGTKGRLKTPRPVRRSAEEAARSIISLLKHRRFHLLLADAVLIAASVCTALAIRFHTLAIGPYLQRIWFVAPLLIAVRLPLFYLFGLHNPIGRYPIAHELLSVIKAVFLGSAIVALVIFGFAVPLGLVSWFPRSVIVLDLFLGFALSGGVRFGLRLSTRRISGSNGDTPRSESILGTGEAEIIGVRAVRENVGLAIRRFAPPACGLLLGFLVLSLGSQVAMSLMNLYIPWSSSDRSVAVSRSSQLLSWEEPYSFVQDHVPQDSVILSDPVNSYYTAGLTGRPVTAVKLTHSPVAIEVRDGPQRRREALAALDEEINLKTTVAILRRYDVEYIFVDVNSPGVAPLSPTSKFDRYPSLFERIYARDQTFIYQFRPQNLLAAVSEASQAPVVQSVFSIELTENISLAGYCLDGDTVHRYGYVVLTLRWQPSDEVRESFSVAIRFSGVNSGHVFTQSFALGANAQTAPAFWHPGMTYEESYVVLLPEDVALDTYQVSVGLNRVDEDVELREGAIGTVSLQDVYQAEEMKGLTLVLPERGNYWARVDGWTTLLGSIYTYGRAAIVDDLGYTIRQQIPELPPGDYQVILQVHDYGQGSSNVLEVGLDGMTKTVEWSGQQKEIKTVPVLFRDVVGATRLSMKSVKCEQPYIIVDEVAILPWEQ